MSHETRMVRLGLGYLIGSDEEVVLNALENLPKKNENLDPFDALQWPCDLEITIDEVRARLKATNQNIGK